MPIHPKAQDAAPMIMYEWKMFKPSAKMLRIIQTVDDPRRAQLGQVLNENYAGAVFLLSFLLHARNLADFLFMRPNANEESDDVVAEHFFETPDEWRNRMVEPGPYLTGNKARMYQVLARPRFGRVEYGRLSLRKWDVDAITREVSQGWEVFWDSLSHEKQGWFDVVPPA
ncbi:MAG: hypothetical protein M5U26_07320 [Planctomycetota bacterium]|nr:hypothetical protein [Planctomycetota bacterium]